MSASKTYDFPWFNEKCKGGFVTLKDRLELCSKLELELTEHTKGQIEDELKKCFFEIRKYGCTESRLSGVYSLLLFFASLKGTRPEERERYRVQYEEIDKENKVKIAIFRNFETGLGRENAQ